MLINCIATAKLYEILTGKVYFFYVNEEMNKVRCTVSERRALTLFKIGIFRDCTEMFEALGIPLLPQTCSTNTMMMKLDIFISYLKRILESHDTPLDFQLH